MGSGGRKSGWPMPRLMMSLPCAASALARASTAKAFSSPIRSNAAMVLSMAFPLGFFALFAATAGSPSTVPAALGALADLDIDQLHDLENHSHRHADHQQAIESRDR